MGVEAAVLATTGIYSPPPQHPWLSTYQRLTVSLKGWAINVSRHCHVVPGGGQFKLEITDTGQSHFASVIHIKNRNPILSFHLEKDSRPKGTF